MPQLLRGCFLGLTFAVATVAQAVTNESATPRGGKGAASVSARLSATAAMVDTAFTATWNWPGATMQLAGGGAGKVNAAKSMAGSFHEDMLWVRLDAEPNAELLQVGRHTLFRRGDAEWQLTKLGDIRVTRFEYWPDPQLLLRLFATWDLQIGDRSTDERDGQAIERVGLTLTTAQLDELVVAGAIQDPQPLPSGLRQMMEQRGVAATEIPSAIVDACLEFEVATGRLQRLRIRALAAPVNTARIRQLAGGRGAGGATPEQADAAPATAGALARQPLHYDRGMPVRAAEGQTERALELHLHQHGAAPRPQLPDPLREKLGRKP